MGGGGGDVAIQRVSLELSSEQDTATWSFIGRPKCLPENCIRKEKAFSPLRELRRLLGRWKHLRDKQGKKGEKNPMKLQVAGEGPQYGTASSKTIPCRRGCQHQRPLQRRKKAEAIRDGVDRIAKGRFSRGGKTHHPESPGKPL